MAVAEHTGPQAASAVLARATRQRQRPELAHSHCMRGAEIAARFGRSVDELRGNTANLRRTEPR